MQQLNSTTFQTPELGDTKPVVTIGGSVADKFIPNVNNSFHDDEFYFNLNCIDDIVLDENATENNGTISQTINNETHEYYIDDSGRLKWDKVFSACPVSMRLRFKVKKSAGINFYYQGELTPEEIADGCERPDNIVGSYAVYCDKVNTKIRVNLLDTDEKLNNAQVLIKLYPEKYYIARRDISDDITSPFYVYCLHEKLTDYKTGKLCHIPRPFVIDTNGNREWCVMTYEEISDTEGMLYIDMPEEFMRSAAYPVRLDPTIGYSSIGASSGGFTSRMYTTLVLPSGDLRADSSGTCSSVFVYSTSATNTMEVGAYDGSSPRNRIATTGSITSGWNANTWRELSVTSFGIVSGNYYYPAFASVDTANLAYDITATAMTAREAYTSLQLTSSATPDRPYVFSIYFKYTESGGGSSLPSIINNHRQQGVM